MSYITTSTALAPAGPPRPAVGPIPGVARALDTRRAIALVVDDLNLSFTSVHSVREALGKFVDEQMQPGDLVAILRTGGDIRRACSATASPCGPRRQSRSRSPIVWRSYSREHFMKDRDLDPTMPPGEYLLQVTAIDKLASKKSMPAVQWTDFALVPVK